MQLRHSHKQRVQCVSIVANPYRGRHARVVRGQMFGAQLLLSGRVALLLLVAHQMGDARFLR